MNKIMHEQIVCAGFGGQGIMLMGKLLAEVGMMEGYEVSWLPSYGAEVRGGTAHSMVHISSEKIASPVIVHPTACIVMNKPSLLKFKDRLKRNALLIVNTSMADSIMENKAVRVVGFPFTSLATDLGNVKVANMIAVGAYIKTGNIFSLKSVLEGLKNKLPASSDTLKINHKAIKLGYDLAEGKKA